MALTAAHCFIENDLDKHEFSPEKVKMSSLDINGNLKSYNVRKVYFHPMYKPFQEYDIAVVQIVGQFDVTIPSLPTKKFVGQISCVMVGYGARHESIDDQIMLSYLEAVTLSDIDCRSINQYENDLICIIIETNQSPCHGDSGGPLICDGIPVGLLSRGVIWGEPGCGNTVYSILFYEDLFLQNNWLKSLESFTTDVSQSGAKLFPTSHGLFVLIVLEACDRIIMQNYN